MAVVRRQGNNRQSKRKCASLGLSVATAVLCSSRANFDHVVVRQLTLPFI
jgi:hypothetical protein